jgi:hypothetical protein
LEVQLQDWKKTAKRPDQTRKRPDQQSGLLILRMKDCKKTGLGEPVFAVKTSLLYP